MIVEGAMESENISSYLLGLILICDANFCDEWKNVWSNVFTGKYMFEIFPLKSGSTTCIHVLKALIIKIYVALVRIVCNLYCVDYPYK